MEGSFLLKVEIVRKVLQNFTLTIERYFEVLLQMSLVLTASASMPVVKLEEQDNFPSQGAHQPKKKTEKNYPVILVIILMEWNLQKKLGAD